MAVRTRPLPRTPKRDVRLRYWMERVDGRFMGTPIDVDPHEALLHCIRVMAGEVAYCDAQIMRLHEDELFERPFTVERTVMPSSGAVEYVSEKQDAEQISRWVALRDLAVDRMAKYSKMALDAGVDERRVRVAEQVADVLAPLLQGLAGELELTAKQRAKLPALIDAKLRQLEAVA